MSKLVPTKPTARDDAGDTLPAPKGDASPRVRLGDSLSPWAQTPKVRLGDSLMPW
ncbi:MAG: hypothetical protein R3D44_01400 [Hyphomicrobiaceae bacterium]